MQFLQTLFHPSIPFTPWKRLSVQREPRLASFPMILTVKVVSRGRDLIRSIQVSRGWPATRDRIRRASRLDETGVLRGRRNPARSRTKTGYERVLRSFIIIYSSFFAEKDDEIVSRNSLTSSASQENLGTCRFHEGGEKTKVWLEMKRKFSKKLYKKNINWLCGPRISFVKQASNLCKRGKKNSSFDRGNLLTSHGNANFPYPAKRSVNQSWRDNWANDQVSLPPLSLSTKRRRTKRIVATIREIPRRTVFSKTVPICIITFHRASFSSLACIDLFLVKTAEPCDTENEREREREFLLG